MFQSNSEKVPPRMQVISMLFGALVAQALIAVAELRSDI